MIGRPWSLTVGIDDVSDFIGNGSTFVEVASSSDGTASFTVNGVRPSVVNGASVTLIRNSVVLWEGTVASFTVQTDQNGNPVSTLVTGAPLAAQLEQQTPFVVTSPTDVGQIASALCSTTPIPYGGNLNFGVEPGSLTFSSASDGLGVLATLVNKSWRVQNGAVQLVDGSNGITPVSGAFGEVTQQAYPSVVVRGGIDINTHIILQTMYVSPTISIGQPRQASYPEVSDQTTLDLVGNVLVQRYGDTGESATLTLAPGFQGRAGDWISDANGVELPIEQLTYSIVNGDLAATILAGYPPLSLAPIYSAATALRQSASPITRLHGDYLISGGTISIAGNQATIAPAVISLADTQYQIPQATLTLPLTGTVQINATTTAFVVAANPGQPTPGMVLQMYLVTMGTVVPGIIALYSNGWVSSNNVLPNNILTQHIAPMNVASIHVLPTRYSSDLNNIAFAAAQEWGSIALARDVTVADTIANADTLIWNVGTAADTVGDPVPAFSQTLTLAAGATITARFIHQAYVSGGIGVPTVVFTGSSAGGSGNVVASTTISGSSSPQIQVRGNRFNQIYFPVNGAVVSYTTPSNTVAPAVATPLTLTLTTLTTPSDTNGSSGVTISLVDPGGTTRQTWTNQTGPGPKTFTFSTSGFAGGSWTWKLQGVIITHTNQGPDIYTDSWSGSSSYYIPGTAGGAVLVLAGDGVTQRTAVSDDNVKFTKQTYAETDFQITNSAASALTFTLGFDISGL